MNTLTQRILISMLLAASATLTSANTPIKKQIEQEGFQFIKQIPAPTGMTGWVGHNNQHPGTVFISNDEQYYIVGDLYNVKGSNLSIDAMNKHSKDVVLEDVWKTLAKSTWIQDGDKKAPRIVYIFSDPNCPYCHTLWQQARPWIKSGQVQLRHIQVGVIREESRGQVATLLMSKDPAATFADLNLNKAKKSLAPSTTIPTEISEKIDFNQELMGKYGFFSTPSVVWKDSKGNFKSTQGMPKDLKEIFEK
ncbi:thiol:disulfide interchange protein DsbG [Acinetobacter sp. ANC 4779]|uniref:thiol:disulfide interchange protein DsbG n=1 Tax=Acinetobacter sp. ANC 4779 TaxID=2529848 RepID=UPI00103A123E|nr:thiol:disulfide interchange protein DsbG [Acinetobacter sp. ANC 4779]TCB50078.1 thiol:disulfide interchange protein DsbG [Acinetobacter sp. ANC 4779]